MATVENRFVEGPIARFSTAGLSQPEAFLRALEFYETLGVGMDVTALKDNDFSLDTGMMALGATSYSCGEISGLRGTRVLRDNLGSDALLITRLTAAYSHRQQGREFELPAGSVFAIAFDAPATLEYGQGAFHESIWVDRSALATHLPGHDPYALTVMDPYSPAVRLLFDYAASAWNSATLQSPLLHLAGRHLGDLAIQALSGRRGDEEVRVGAREARFDLLLRELETDFGDPRTSIKGLAARHGISPRYLQRLFEAHGLKASDHLLDLRLRKAHRLLVDPAQAGLKIADIAARCGFDDLSTFNRQIRRRFGDTPRGLRQA